MSDVLALYGRNDGPSAYDRVIDTQDHELDAGPAQAEAPRDWRPANTGSIGPRGEVGWPTTGGTTVIQALRATPTAPTAYPGVITIDDLAPVEGLSAGAPQVG